MKKTITLLLICLTFSSFANRAAIDCRNDSTGLDFTLLFNPSVSLILEGERYEVILTETENSDLSKSKYFSIKTNTLLLGSLGITDYPDFSIVFEDLKGSGYYALMSGDKGFEELDCDPVRLTGLE